MIRWLLWHLFKLIPTCQKCGHQTHTPEVKFHDGGNPDSAFWYDACPACGHGEMAYRKRRPPLRLVRG